MIHKTLFLVLAVCSVFSSSLQAQQRCDPPAALTSTTEPNIFTEQQEVDLGDAIAEHIQSNFRVIDDSGITAHLRSIGERVVKHLPATRLNFRFFLVDLPEANAFVLPGGRIYVSRKLVAFSESEDELAGVIAHEIGHLVARQQTILVTRQLKEVLGVTKVGNRADIFANYNRLVESVARKPGAFRQSGSHEGKDQIVADQIGLFAAISSGYDPTAPARLLDRLTQAGGKTGGFFSDVFGATKPEVRRARELIKSVENLPAACIESRSAVAADKYLEWQAAVITYSGGGRKESLHSVLSRTALDPPIRGEVTHLRFSPDGRYLVAQDDSGISLLSRQPFATLFRIAAPEANRAQFTPDSENVVFYNSDLRVEMWNIAGARLKEAHELVIRRECAETALAPDGKTMACLYSDYTLNLFDVGSGALLFQKKPFYTPNDADIVLQYLLGATGSGSEEEASMIVMGFSTDSHYFAAGKKGATETSALVFDLKTRATVSLKESVRKMIAGNFVFTGPDRLIATNNEDPRKSALISLPTGAVLEQFPMFQGKWAPVARGNYMLVRPIRQYPVGVMDIAKGEIFKVNETAALDVYENVLVAERLTGELGLYRVDNSELQATVQLPGNQLGRLRAAAVSPDFKWLALSERKRGAVWDMSTGKRILLERGFRGGHITDTGIFAADFPEYRDLKRQLAQVDLSRPGSRGTWEIKEPFVRQFGNLLLTSNPANQNGTPYEDVILTMQDALTLQPLWTKPFVKEAPSIWVSPQHDTMVLGWPVQSKAAQAEIKANSALSERFRAMKQKEEDYLLEVFDARSGGIKGQLLIETGKGSFEIEDVFAVNDWVVISDTENRTLLYSLEGAAKKGQVFGGHAEVAAESDLIAVENESGQLTIYDLRTMQKVDELAFAHPLSLIKFSKDGKKLFVLAADQTAYVLDLSSSIAAKSR